MTTLTSAAPTYYVTAHGHPREKILTQWGEVEYSHWLHLEVARWKETNGRSAWVHEDKEGLVALESFAEYQKPTGEE